MKLEGERIFLKPISVEYAENYLKWVSDPEVTKFMIGLNPPKTLQGEIDWIDGILKNPNEEVWSIFIKENDKLIGNVGFHDLDNHEKNLRMGIVIGEKDEWGKGYGTEVFKVATKYLKEVKGAQTINLTCHINNFGAQKVYKNSGFKVKNKIQIFNPVTKKDEEMFYMEKAD